MESTKMSAAAAMVGDGYEMQQLWRDDDDGQYTFVEAMEEHMPSYDESLYYACKEYVRIHALYYKQLKRSNQPEEVPLRYSLLMLWTRPLATVAGQCYFAFQCLLVVASITQLVLETIPRYSAEVYPEMQSYWDAVEIPTASFFFFDICVHMLLLPPVPNDFSRYSRRTYIRKLEFWVDVMTIIPTILAYLAIVVPELPQVDFLKALRILRFTKVLRQFHAVDQLVFTLERSWKPLLGPFVFLFGTLVTVSGAVYYLERGDYDPVTQTFRIDDYDCLMSAPRTLNPLFPCPKLRSKFISLPHTLWFCLVTITTVGYGDMVPHTSAGRACATVCILCGNVLTAMPIAIVGTYFTDIVTSNRLRQAGDASRAFGRKAAAAARNAELQQRMSGGAAKDLTIGERLLDILAANDDVIDLADPAGVSVHQVNAFMRNEFDATIASLQRIEGVRKIKASREAAVTPLCFNRKSHPHNSQCPAVTPLSKPLPIVVGDVPGALRLTLPGYYPESLPAVLFTASLSTHPPYAVSIRPAFPAVVQVNGVLIGYDTPSRLLVGDTVSIHAHSRGPPLFIYLYGKSDGDGGSNAALVKSKTAAQQQASSGSGGGGQPQQPGMMTLRTVAAPSEHRGLTFSAFAPRAGHRPFDDL